MGFPSLSTTCPQTIAGSEALILGLRKKGTKRIKKRREESAFERVPISGLSLLAF